MIASKYPEEEKKMATKKATKTKAAPAKTGALREKAPADYSTAYMYGRLNYVGGRE
jgi:hypothetical protein